MKISPFQRSRNTRTFGLVATSLSLLMAACAAPSAKDPGKGHLTAEAVRRTPAGEIPPPVQQTLTVPKPRPAPKVETYSVVVNKVPVRDLLFALARDAKLNVDIHPGIGGEITLNAIDQTLPQLLARITKQTDTRFELDGPNLVVTPDSPVLKHYKVDYVNMSRNVSGTVSNSTQIATAAGAAGGTPGGSAVSNVSSTKIENASKNSFWESLERNIKDILRETDKILPEGSSETIVEQATAQSATGAAALPQSSGQKAAQAIANALTSNPNPNSSSQGTGSTIVKRSTFREAASVIVNPESGVITVRATQRQHEKIQEFVDRVILSARRQVMIEATIVEVVLGDGYEQGIDWTRLVGSGTFKLVNTLGTTKNLTFNDTTATNNFGNNGRTIKDTAISFLETFGTTKVLSSPRLSVLNNQTALLRVVDNYVFFNVKAEVTPGNLNANPIISYTTTPQTVPVGLVLAVTPQVSENDNVILNIRPTITSVSGEVLDPNPNLAAAKIENKVPQIRTREIESVMRVASGDIAVLGGLMDDRVVLSTGRVPGVSQIPIAGELFTNRNNKVSKTELVIFLRPVVIRDASLGGDYAALKDALPGADFLAPPPEAQPFNIAPRR